MTEARGEGRGATLYRGDCLDILRTLEPDSIDAVITDPPYSSGGFTRGDRTTATSKKYVQTGTAIERPEFVGDSRDQRSWIMWCGIWLAQALKATRPGGYCLMFSDWRQLPAASDALQAGGWVWRGIVVWDKTEAARPPNSGYFRHQCEYIVWGTKGPTSTDYYNGPWPGVFRLGVSQADKHHITGKPTDLMRQLVQVCPTGGTVLDPFMGSGTTGVACRLEGRDFIGIELDATYYKIAERRIVQTVKPAELALFAQAAD